VSTDDASKGEFGNTVSFTLPATVQGFEVELVGGGRVIDYVV
jgi:hypothetical protein